VSYIKTEPKLYLTHNLAAYEKKGACNIEDHKATVRTSATFVALMPNLKVFNLLQFCYAANKPIQFAFCFKIIT